MSVVASWTPAEALAHLRLTFESACTRHLEVMEPYIVMRAECQGDAAQEMAIMRQGLRETILQRYPFTMEAAK